MRKQSATRYALFISKIFVLINTNRWHNFFNVLLQKPYDEK